MCKEAGGGSRSYGSISERSTAVEYGLGGGCDHVLGFDDEGADNTSGS